MSPSGLVLSVTARRLREASAVGSTFEMSCQAHVQNLPPGTAFSILVLSEEAVGSPSRKLASLGPEMVLQLEEDRDLMLVKTGKREFQFRIPAVQETDRGFYWCEMKAWTRQSGEDWVEMAKGVSNKVQIHFIHKGTEYQIISQKHVHFYHLIFKKLHEILFDYKCCCLYNLCFIVSLNCILC